MKRLFAILLIMTMTVSLCSCGQATSSNGTNSKNTSAETAQQFCERAIQALYGDRDVNAVKELVCPDFRNHAELHEGISSAVVELIEEGVSLDYCTYQRQRSVAAAEISEMTGNLIDTSKYDEFLVLEYEIGVTECETGVGEGWSYSQNHEIYVAKRDGKYYLLSLPL